LKGDNRPFPLNPTPLRLGRATRKFPRICFRSLRVLATREIGNRIPPAGFNCGSRKTRLVATDSNDANPLERIARIILDEAVGLKRRATRTSSGRYCLSNEILARLENSFHQTFPNSLRPILLMNFSHARIFRIFGEG